MNMTYLSSHRPYLLQEFYEWLLDKHLMPHLVVDVNVYGVIVPMRFAHNERIVLNIAPHAVLNLVIGENDVQFNACFSGVPYQIVVPMKAVLAVYARENGASIIFKSEKTHKAMMLLKRDNIDNLAMKNITSAINTDLANNLHVSEDEPLIQPRKNGRPLLRVVR